MRDVSDDLSALRKRHADAATYLKIDELRARQPQLETEASRPDLWDDPDRARQVTGELSAVTDDVDTYDALAAEISDAETLFELGQEEDDASVADELTEQIASIARRFDQLELRSLFTGEYDDHDAVCELHSGEGGTDSQDFTEMLLRMYRRWAERNGYEFELDEATDGQEAGLSSATFIIKGRHAYGRLRGEKGTHRLVRISPFNAQGKRQTAFAGFTIVPFLEEAETDVVIDDKDLRIDVYRSSGSGGQHLNVTDSAVRITHLPTGIVVSCQNERSQHQNKDRAMAVLRAKLADLEREKRDAALEELAGPKQTMGFGTRIRSYVLHPYQQVKDERSGLEIGDVEGVLDGDLDPLIEAYLRHQRETATAS